jgi:hypothetical protein
MTVLALRNGMSRPRPTKVIALLTCVEPLTNPRCISGARLITVIASVKPRAQATLKLNPSSGSR